MASSIDPLDASHSQLRLILSEALRHLEEHKLLDLLLDEDIILRTSSARELHVRGTERSFVRAIEMASAKRFEHREIGAFLLGQLGTPRRPFGVESLDPLKMLLGDDYYEVRSTAVGAIGFLVVGGVLLTDQLLRDVMRLASDRAPAVRESVAYTLGFCQTKAALPVLEALYSDLDPRVSDAAEFALENLS